MEESRNCTFEWKIDKFLEKKFEFMESPSFIYGRQNCCLYVASSTISCTRCPHYYIFSLVNTGAHEAFNDRDILQFSLTDTLGEDIFVTKQQSRRQLNKHIHLMTISEYQLIKNMSNPLPGGILTVRLSWYEKLEQETQTTPDLISNTQGPQTMLDTLSKDFSCFFESKEDADCVLRVGDAKFPVHRAVLSARSEVFAAMFRHDTSETRSGVVDIQDVEAGVLSDFLHIVYSGKVHGLTADTAVPLYNVADKYALLELRDFCLDFLMNNLMIGNVCDAAVLAHSHGEEELERKVVQFLQDKMEEVQNGDEWKNFELNKPSLALKLLRFTVIASKDKIKKTSSK